MLVLFGTREAGCFREMAVLYSDHYCIGCYDVHYSNRASEGLTCGVESLYKKPRGLLVHCLVL